MELCFCSLLNIVYTVATSISQTVKNDEYCLECETLLTNRERVVFAESFSKTNSADPTRFLKRRRCNTLPLRYTQTHAIYTRHATGSHITISYDANIFVRSFIKINVPPKLILKGIVYLARLIPPADIIFFRDL